MSANITYGWSETLGKWVPLAVDENGKINLYAPEIFESPPTENTTDKGVESGWVYDHKENESAHHTKTIDASELTTGLIDNARIPANIARDNEIVSKISDHADVNDAHHAKTGDDEVKGLLRVGTAANRPAAGTAGQMYYSTDTSTLEYDDGSAWQEISTGGGGESLDVWLTASDWNAPVAYSDEQDHFWTTIQRTGSTDQIVAIVKVPAGATGIDSITIWYLCVSDGDLYLLFRTSQVDLSAGDTIDNDATDGYSTYAGTKNEISNVTVPSAAYDGITIVGGGLFGLRIIRAGQDGNDTYNEHFKILATHVKFS